MAVAVPVLFTLVVLGLLTCGRLVQGSVEDHRHGRAIDRIRAVYRQLAGTRADELLLLEGSGDVAGVLRNMGVDRTGVPQLALTNATAVAVGTAVLAGALTGVVTGPALAAPPRRGRRVNDPERAAYGRRPTPPPGSSGNVWSIGAGRPR